MPRVITLFALAQLFLAVAANLILRGMLKFVGYPDRPDIVFGSIAVSVRHHGGWLLFLPVLWFAYAMKAERQNAGWFRYRWAMLLGMALSLWLLWLTVWGAATSHHIEHVVGSGGF